MKDDVPLPDQLPGAPHPRDTVQLFGHPEAEAAFLDAFAASRLHHAWLLSGPRGIGKATLAYRLARFLLATPSMDGDNLLGRPAPPNSLHIPPDHPVCARIRAGAEPGLRAVTRTPNEKDRMRTEIVVDNIRKLVEFFQLSAPDGGHRVVIVDSADEMNPSAANALLKMLEEPPAATTLLLVSHQPSRLLPTIRSRCRSLRLRALNPQDMQSALEQAGADIDAAATALSELAAGSVGAALRLAQNAGLDIYAHLIALMGGMPDMNRARARAMAEAAAQRGSDDKLDLFIALIDIALTRLARTGATGQPAPDAAPTEGATFARLAPTPHAGRLWATRAGEISARLHHGKAVNLDPQALVLDTLIKLNDTARDTAQTASA